MHTFLHLLEHAALDCLKMLPFLFLAYLLIEYVEQSQTARLQKLLAGNGRWGFAVGGMLGLVPQCGFSAMAANLYAGRVITPGTLLAVFIATSDEALPLLAAGGDWRTLLVLIGCKLAMALVCGFVLDRAVAIRRGGWGGYSGRQEDVYCGADHETEGNIFLAALRHTLQVFALVFVLTFAFGALMELAGEEWIASVLAGMGPLQVPLAALVGFVPNCAASVLLMQMYTGGMLSFGALFAGLCSGAGVGLIVLWRTNPSKKGNLKLMGVLYLCAVAGGYLASLVL
ncbi:MAG: arsenic efflux protein [Oscillospiraceae bacterium]|nr:arsenic efflux protein [Oscillospiraceae bacterium]